jgi:hypothetical protein
MLLLFSSMYYNFFYEQYHKTTDIVVSVFFRIGISQRTGNYLIELCLNDQHVKSLKVDYYEIINFFK